MKIRIDSGRCASSGRCVFYAGAVFEQDPNDGSARLILPDPPPELHALVRDAAANCPSAAIHITD